MLTATRELLDRYVGEDVDQLEQEAYADVIADHGDATDAEALLNALPAAPESRGALLPAIAELVDAETARRLVDACFTDGRVAGDVPEEVLQVVGYLGYTPAEKLLWELATGDRQSEISLRTHPRPCWHC